MAWAERLNSAFFEKNGKDEPETAKFGNRPVFAKFEDRPEPKIRVANEPEVKRQPYGFRQTADESQDDGEDNLDVPPILRRGGSFKSIAVSREEDDFEPAKAGPDEPEDLEQPPMAASDDDDLELPSFIRKKMK